MKKSRELLKLLKKKSLISEFFEEVSKQQMIGLKDSFTYICEEVDKSSIKDVMSYGSESFYFGDSRSGFSFWYRIFKRYFDSYDDFDDAL